MVSTLSLLTATYAADGKSALNHIVENEVAAVSNNSDHKGAVVTLMQTNSSKHAKDLISGDKNIRQAIIKWVLANL